jgi:hypothetical protein
LVYGFACLIVIGLGLLSRSRSISPPQWVIEYAGDALWAMTAFLALGAAFPWWSTRRAAAAALAFSFAIELSQLYQAPWIDGLRRNRIGALFLGRGFLWSDLVCYIAGVLLGVLLERSGLKDLRFRPFPSNLRDHNPNRIM